MSYLNHKDVKSVKETVDGVLVVLRKYSDVSLRRALIIDGFNYSQKRKGWFRRTA